MLRLIWTPLEKCSCFLSSSDSFQHQYFRNILAGIRSECLTDWIQISFVGSDLVPICSQILWADDSNRQWDNNAYAIDFAKAFVMVKYRRLLYKLYYYFLKSRSIYKLMTWIKTFKVWKINCTHLHFWSICDYNNSILLCCLVWSIITEIICLMFVCCHLSKILIIFMLQKYLEDYQFKNVGHDDLWYALGNVSKPSSSISLSLSLSLSLSHFFIK